MLRNIFSYVLYIGKFRKLTFIVSIIGFFVFIFSVYQLYIDFFTLSDKITTGALIISSLILLFDVILFVVDLKSIKGVAHYTIQKKNYKINSISQKQKNGYSLLLHKYLIDDKVCIEPLLTKNKINKFIRNKQYENIEIIIDKEKRKKIQIFLKANFSKLVLFLKFKFRDSIVYGRDFYNEKKLCLSRDFDDSGTVYCHKGSYYTFFLTNSVAGKYAINREGKTVANFINLFPLNNDGQLENITQINFDNHIGISTIAFTKDNFMVFWIQNARAQSSNNLVVPTGSGSCDYNDVFEMNFYKTIKKAMERELFEESTTLKKPYYKHIKNTKLLGYFRWFNKAGKPEFAGMTKLKIDYTTLRSNKKEVRESNEEFEKFSLVYQYKNTKDLISHIKKIISENNYLSVPLFFNLKMIEEYAEESFSDFESFIE